MAPKGEEKSTFSVRKAHFFKVLLGNFSEHLMIPPNFMKHMSGRKLKRVILQGPSGKQWQVELSSNKGGTFLASGWQKFVKDHSLHEHEFLLFRYDGIMHFTVFVFDTSACEREDLFVVTLQKRSRVFEEKDRQAMPTKHTNDNETKETHFTTSLVKNEEFEEYESKPLQIGCSDSLLGGCVPYQDPYPKFEKKISQKPISMIRRRNKRFICVPKRRPVSTEERLKAQEAANSFTSIHPYTIVSMRPREVYKCCPLRLPVRFSRKHLPRKRTDMVLHVPSGKSWVVGFLPKARYRARDSFSKGWAAFVRGNNIEEGDYCVFELIGRAKFQVHIFRIVDKIVPAIKKTLEDVSCKEEAKD